MVWSIITFGGVIFWVLTAIAAIALVSEISANKVGAAFFTLLAYTAVMMLFSNTPVWTWIKDHPSYLLYGFGLYIVCGAIWSVIKWYFYLLNIRDRYEDLRSAWLKRQGFTDVPTDANDRAKFKADVVDRVPGTYGVFPPQASHHKGAITTWMMFWPFSLAGTVFGDFLNRIFKTVYSWLAGMMQRISNGVFGKYSELN